MKEIEEYTIPLYSEDGFEGTIEPLNLELSENLKYIIQLQEELQTKMDNSILGIPTHYFGISTHYCKSSGEKCDKQCKYCKDEQ